MQPAPVPPSGPIAPVIRQRRYVRMGVSPAETAPPAGGATGTDLVRLVEASLHLPPSAGAFTPEEIEALGVPRGLIRYAPPAPEAAVSSEGLTESASSEDLDELIDSIAARLDALHAHVPRRIAPTGLVVQLPEQSPLRRIGAPAGSGHEALGIGRILGVTLLMVGVSATAFFGGFKARHAFAPAAPVDPPTVESDPPEPAEERSWGDAARAQLDEYLSAEKADSIDEMGLRLAALQKDHPKLPGLEMLAARQALRAGRVADAEVRLSRLAGEGEAAERAEAGYLRGQNHAGKRKLLDASRGIQEAIALDPFPAEYFYERAELDRRMGRISEALAGYQSAMLRVQTGQMPSRGQIEFHRRLLLIEAGREVEIGTERYLAELARPEPPGEWLLTAAAVSLHRGGFVDASRWMQRARATMPADAYLASIEDYFFRNHTGRTELQAVFPAPAERAAFLARRHPFVPEM